MFTEVPFDTDSYRVCYGFHHCVHVDTLEEAIEEAGKITPGKFTKVNIWRVVKVKGKFRWKLEKSFTVA